MSRSKHSKFISDGLNIHTATIPPGTFMDSIPPAIYTVNWDKLQGFFLTNVDDKFKVPSRIFGSNETLGRAKKIVTTFLDRDQNTGISLKGEKGSGKTMLAQVVGNNLIDLGIPVIVINSPYGGQAFVEFIDKLGICCVFIDEFGKKYPADSDSNNGDGSVTQEDLLTFFDGESRSKRMIIITENNSHEISEFMQSRPGRIYYTFSYKKLGKGVLREYMAFKGVDNDTQEKIEAFYAESKNFNFDMLQAIVEEFQRYGDLKTCFEDLNLGNENDDIVELQIEKIVDKISGEEVFLSWRSLSDKITLNLGKYANHTRLMITTHFKYSLYQFDREQLKHMIYDEDGEMMNSEESGADLYDHVNIRPHHLKHKSNDIMTFFVDQKYIVVARVVDAEQVVWSDYGQR